MARREGIACNVRYVYLAGFIWELIGRLLPGVAEKSPFDPEILSWKIFKFLGALPKDKEFAPLREYLQGRDF